eukprot:TRINITY_DN17401_c0_g1_i1.p1 TRINITY_DN17401_c0_g1~~TRINITY_DN17401_c0_g1_i1.p1  ORF type:complete len:165 (+),score=14.78 TRINITY_DN17401_c0_g1_i1:60-497(+)
MLKLTRIINCTGSSRWIQGTNTVGVDESEPWHPAGAVYAGESTGKPVMPTFTKEEWDFDNYVSTGKYTRVQSDMRGGERRYATMRRYNKLYELEGGIKSRGHFRLLSVPTWPDRRMLPKTKGYRDVLGFVKITVSSFSVFPVAAH